MKTMPLNQAIQAKLTTAAKPGFALISTISIMALLLMVAMAMLSLSAIEQRTIQNDRAMTEARANARMALIIAIGELQKYAGPDQRVTATGALLSDDAVQPRWTGVWSTKSEDSLAAWLS